MRSAKEDDSRGRSEDSLMSTEIDEDTTGLAAPEYLAGSIIYKQMEGTNAGYGRVNIHP